jgi:hypothetical protein
MYLDKDLQREVPFGQYLLKIERVFDGQFSLELILQAKTTRLYMAI